MDKQEANSIYADLLSFLKSNNLNWIAKQVEAEIALGHIGTKRLDVSSKDSSYIIESFLDIDSYDIDGNLPKDLSSEKIKRSKAVFVVSTPYSEHEKLKLLVDSIEIGIAELSEIVNTTIEFFQQETQLNHIGFEPEADVKEQFEITVEQAKSTYDNSRKLIPLLNELRKEIEYANQK